MLSVICAGKVRGKFLEIKMRLAVLKVMTSFALAGMPVVAGHAQEQATFHILRTIPLGEDGSWDYLRFDQGRDRLFIARSTRVMVVNLASGKLAGEIPGTDGVHGVALDTALGRGVTSNGKANDAFVFDLDSLKVLATVPTGAKPDGILWEPFSKTVLTMNSAANTMTVIDVALGKPLATIALPGRPESAVSDGKGKVYVNLEDKGQIAEVDLAARSVLGTWDLTGCTEPTGLAIDTGAGRLFSACHNGVLIVVDANSGRNIQKLPIGAGVDAAAYDPEIHNIFTSNKDGSISRIEQIDANTYRNVQTVPTLPGAKTMALDPARHLLYTVGNRTDESGKVDFVLLEIGR
jgi:DNA-binding beta-propeller fold protein YncE